MAVTIAETSGHVTETELKSPLSPPVTMRRNDRSHSPKYAAANRRGDMFEMRRRMMADWAMFSDTVEMKGKTATPTPSDELIGRIPHEMNHPINSL